MPVREEKRNLNSIPVGSLGIVPLEGCKTCLLYTSDAADEL